MSIRLQAWTDGGCRGNPGVGAWAFLLVDTHTHRAMQRADGETHTTNNRMEMMAAIETLRTLRKAGQEILIHSDSRYLIDCCSKWMPGWKRNGWKRKGGELKNLDLLHTLDGLLQQHRVSWKWVKGHSGDPGNEHVDGLLNSVMDSLQRQPQTPARIDERLEWPQ